jgi:hypothetical protein
MKYNVVCGNSTWTDVFIIVFKLWRKYRTVMWSKDLIFSPNVARIHACIYVSVFVFLYMYVCMYGKHCVLVTCVGLC